MNSFSKDFFGICRRILTEVPGWPDAPRKLRLRRMIPIVAPVAAMILLALWNLVWTQPRVRQEREAHQPLILLEQELETLRVAFSQEHADATADRAATAGRILFKDPKQVTPALARLKEAARAAGWDATFHAMTSGTPDAQGDAGMYFVALRGKLTPTKGNLEPFASLLALLELLSPPDQWIDLTRLTLRADEQGRHAVEIQLRAGCLLPP